MTRAEALVKMSELLTAVADAMVEANNFWDENLDGADEAMTKDYPFQHSFDTMFVEVQAWADSVKEAGEAE